MFLIWEGNYNFSHQCNVEGNTTRLQEELLVDKNRTKGWGTTRSQSKRRRMIGICVICVFFPPFYGLLCLLSDVEMVYMGFFLAPLSSFA